MTIAAIAPTDKTVLREKEVMEVERNLEATLASQRQWRTGWLAFLMVLRKDEETWRVPGQNLREDSR